VCASLIQHRAFWVTAWFIVTVKVACRSSRNILQKKHSTEERAFGDHIGLRSCKPRELLLQRLVSMPSFSRAFSGAMATSYTRPGKMRPSMHGRGGYSMTRPPLIICDIRNWGRLPIPVPIMHIYPSLRCPAALSEIHTWQYGRAYRTLHEWDRKCGNEFGALTQHQPQEERTMSFREVVEQHAIEIGGRPADNDIISSNDSEDGKGEWEDVEDVEQIERGRLGTPLSFQRAGSTSRLPSRHSALTAGIRRQTSATSKSEPVGDLSATLTT